MAKKKRAKRSTTPRKAAKRDSGKLIKTIITDKQIAAVRKSVTQLSKDVQALEKELHDGGTINLPAIHKMVESAVQLETSVREQTAAAKKATTR